MSEVTVSDWLLVASALAGPIIAVQVQKWIERSREQTAQRLRIFQTLMATRALRADSNDHVQALNMIDLHFHGKSKKEKDVRNAWSSYIDFLSQLIESGRTDSEWKVHNDKGVDYLIDLLQVIGKTLDFDFTKVQLRRSVYNPQAHVNLFLEQAAIRGGLVKLLTGVEPLKMSVVNVPTDNGSK